MVSPQKNLPFASFLLCPSKTIPRIPRFSWPSLQNPKNSKISKIFLAKSPEFQEFQDFQEFQEFQDQTDQVHTFLQIFLNIPGHGQQNLGILGNLQSLHTKQNGTGKPNSPGSHSASLVTERASRRASTSSDFGFLEFGRLCLCAEASPPEMCHNLVNAILNHQPRLLRCFCLCPDIRIQEEPVGLTLTLLCPFSWQ